MRWGYRFPIKIAWSDHSSWWKYMVLFIFFFVNPLTIGQFFHSKFQKKFRLYWWDFEKARLQNTWSSKKKIHKISNPQCRSRVVMQSPQLVLLLVCLPVVVSRCNDNQLSCKMHYFYPLFNLSRRIFHYCKHFFKYSGYSTSALHMYIPRSLFHEPKQARFHEYHSFYNSRATIN